MIRSRSEWVRLADLTPEVIRRMEAEQRMLAAHEGWLDEYEREYGRRMAGLAGKQGDDR